MGDLVHILRVAGDTLVVSGNVPSKPFASDGISGADGSAGQGGGTFWGQHQPPEHATVGNSPLTR